MTYRLVKPWTGGAVYPEAPRDPEWDAILDAARARGSERPETPLENAYRELRFAAAQALVVGAGVEPTTVVLPPVSWAHLAAWQHGEQLRRAGANWRRVKRERRKELRRLLRNLRMG